MKFRQISIILFFALICAIPAKLFAASVNGTPYDNLTAALDAISGAGDYTVQIESDQTIAPYTLHEGVNLTLATNGGAHNVNLSSNGAMFRIAHGATFTLADNVTLVGRSGNSSSLVLVDGGGVFNMNGGAITQNSISSNTASGAGRGGAVGIDSADGGGTFNMRGGEIYGNSVVGTGGTVGESGGVFVYGNGAVFNLYDGTIRDNTNSVVNASIGNGAGGVYVSNGTFNMYGGEIVNNSQTGSLARAGGGVYLAYSSSFHMSGGTIANNSTTTSASGNGDGVFIIGTASIYLSGDPVIDDGIFASGNFSTSVRIDGALDEDAHIVVLGSGQSGQMNPSINLTAPFPDVQMSNDAARAFVSKDNTLIGKLGGTTANPRIVWAYNYEVEILPDTVIIDTATYGYEDAAPLAYTITVRNLAMPTGELSIVLAGDNADDFTLSQTTLGNINAIGGTATFAVSPKLGLDVRTRSAQVEVSGDHGIFASAEILFTVVPKPISVNHADINYEGKIYDGTTDATGPAVIMLSTASGILAGDTGSIVATYESAVYDNHRAGLRNVTFWGLALRGAAAVNYILTDDRVVKPNVVITRRDLVVKAVDQLVTEGITCHDLAGLESSKDAYMFIGLVGGDTKESIDSENITSVVIDLFYEDGELEDLCYGGDEPELPHAGTYPIYIYNATFANYRYTPSFVPGILTISGKEDISDSIRADSTVWVDDTGFVFVYDGKPHSPTFVYDAYVSTIDDDKFKLHFVGTLLSGGSYDSDTPPTEAGDYFVEVKYEDDVYIGKVSTLFTIAPRPLTISRAQHTKLFDGSRNALGTNVTLADIIDGDDVSAGYVSAQYTDVNAGTTSLVILNIKLEGAKSSNYTLANLPDTFTVAGITQKPITPNMFTIARQTFSGSLLTPVPMGMDGSNAVTFDYGPYTNNRYAGTASVLVVGTGNYIGTLTLEFAINQKPITPAMFYIASQVVTGDSIKPAPNAQDGNNIVTFVIDGYENNVHAGTGIVRVHGTGNYTGAISLTFPIYADDDCIDIDDDENCFPPHHYGGSGSVTLANWTYGDPPNDPVIFSSTNNYADDVVIIEYKLRSEDDDAYTTTVPTNAGYYTIRVIFPPTGEYDEYAATSDFRIIKGEQDRPDVPGLRGEGLGKPQDIHTVAPDVPRIPATESGLDIAISDRLMSIAYTDDLDMESWEYCADNGNNYIAAPTFEVLPNTEYVILIRKRETQNYFASLPVALLVRTATVGAGGSITQNTAPSNDNTQTSTGAQKTLAGNINLTSNVITSQVRFNVEVEDAASINVVIYNHLGGVMFSRSNVKSGEEILWNAGAAGVANGTYLIRASARGLNGKSIMLEKSVGVFRR